MSISLLKKVLEATRRMLPMTSKGQQTVLFNVSLALLRESQRPAVRHKKILQEIHNSALSLKEGISTSDADQSDIRVFLKEVNVAIDKAAEEEEAEDLKKQQKPEPFSGLNLPNQRVTDEIIQHFDKFKSLLPKRLRVPFKALRMPIIPITKLPLKRDVLKKLGMSRVHIGGYPVIENQLVVGMDYDWMISNFQEKKKDDIQKKATEYILAALKDRTNQDWVLLGRGKREGYILWIWVAKHSEANRLYKASVGNHLTVLQWGFAFNPIKKGH